jgi:integrase
MGLTKRKDSYYIEFPVVDDGKVLTLARGIHGARLKRWKVGSLNRTMAKQQESLIKTELLKGVMKSEQNAPMLFAQWADTYLTLEEVRSLSTYKDRVDSVIDQLKPFFGQKLLGDITPSDVEAFRAQRKLKSGEAPALATINADHACFKHMLSVAERRGLVASNAAKKVPLPDPQNERDRVLIEDDWFRLYDVAAEHLKPILLVAYHLGPRLSEILKLTWDRVDIYQGFIQLRGVDTKTGEPRLVPMTPPVQEAFRYLSKLRSLTCPYVFQYKGKAMHQVKRSFRTAVRKAGITNFRFHDLRHCAATNLRRAGVDTVTAMKIVGHKSEKMHKRYNSVSEADLRLAAKKLDSYQSNTVITPANNSPASAALCS